MSNTLNSIKELVAQQRAYFQTEMTRSLDFRQGQLAKLKKLIISHQTEIETALKTDLNKSPLDVYLAEIFALIQEIDYALKHLKQWLKPQRVRTNLSVFPSTAAIYPDPLGVVLIISPWNYPFGLALSPMIGAIAAGNCVVLKPSEISEATSKLLAKLINENFDPRQIVVIEGGVETSQNLLKEKFDHIFFTGGTKIGKIVMEAAAKHLTPVTLELGGKSPCIVEPDLDIEVTAKRIVWGKFLNAGQTCVAPDYLLVNQSLQEPLIQALKTAIQQFYGYDPRQSPDYGRLINTKQLERLSQLLNEGEIICGGQWDERDRYFAPTLITKITAQNAIMQEEIFGP
ncbi:MAG: aldehyde dehydrogenase family protein, partial [Microcystaceae cyanobacterium]